MKFIELYNIVILWIGVVGAVASIDYANYPALGAFVLLAFTAIVFKDAVEE